MKATELRVGNLIRRATGWKDKERGLPIKFTNYPLEVEAIGHGELSVSSFPENDGLMDIPFSDGSGIKLTEEWLKKFGFEPEANYFKLNIKMYGVVKYSSDSPAFCIRGNISFVFYSGFSMCLSDVHFVHQLQNLFFCLTGEELTPKE